MKLWKKLLVVSGVLVFGSLIGNSEAEAYFWPNVQVPNANLHNYLNDTLLETYQPNEGENPQEDAQRGGVPNYLFEQEFDFFTTGVSAMGYNSASLEGLQYVKTKKLVLSSFSLDLNPIAQIRDLEELDFSLAGGQGYGGYGKTGPADLSFMRNELRELRSFTYRQEDTYETTKALVDISELSEHLKLEKVNIQTSGGLQGITMKKGYRKYELYDPIVLSSQFDGAAIEYSSPDATFTNTDGLLRWLTVPMGTEYLSLNWTVTQGSFHYEGETQIPINWK